MNKSELAKSLGINRTTLYNWKKSQPHWLKVILNNETIRQALKEIIK